MSSDKITDENLKLSERGAILFGNFFLIILAYYHIKPASRSLFIEYLGADLLPYVWIATAVVLGTLIGFYHRLVERYSRFERGTRLMPAVYRHARRIPDTVDGRECGRSGRILHLRGYIQCGLG